MNKQEIFDTVATALLKQGNPSATLAVNEGGNASVRCHYLMEDGRRCGVGHLMNDAEMDVCRDSRASVHGLVSAYRNSLRDFFNSEAYFLRQVQRAHDDAADGYDKIIEGDAWVKGFKENMVKIADEHRLSTAALAA